MKRNLIQITSGKGPIECCRVVALIQDRLIYEAQKIPLHVEILESISGELNGTLLSSTLLVSGQGLEDFIGEWSGTIKWIAQSPYRKYHKRKNWFVGINSFDILELKPWNPSDVRFETCRSSGPGGQNVNKVETAVRAIHLPSGIQVISQDSRSQIENKKRSLYRLEQKILVWQAHQFLNEKQNQWQEHTLLERGNPVKTFEEKL